MLAVVDSKIPSQAAQALALAGFSLLLLPAHPALPLPISSHPDMVMLFGKHRVYTTAQYASIAQKELSAILHATERELHVIDEEIEAEYPKDVLLNSFLLGENLICHASAMAAAIRTSEGARMLAVRQGYAKCSAIPVGQDALITADPSIERKALQNGINVLKLKHHGVRLEGYDTGFIGGAASFSPYGDHRVIYFCGDLYQHPQGEEIQQFCEKHGYTCTSLASIPLTDVGTIIILP
jgi:hypothetical protein